MTKERFEAFGIVDRTILPSGRNDLASDDEDAVESWANDLDEMTLDNSQSIEDDEEEESDILNRNILMVDQLWLWAIDMGCLISSRDEPKAKKVGCLGTTQILEPLKTGMVLIFTVFTVIFLPLSFFTSLFGMNTQEWSGGNNLSLKTIGLIVLPSSAFLVVCAIAGAWIASGSTGFPSMDRYTRMPMQWWKKTINLVIYGDGKPRKQCQEGTNAED
ncbi:hypothetical protein VP1G_02816 [Cytospora mali]|uniref:Uncharacterized protein n=1 Tax=Cytospora mali TaxID=578113 RepID=A0A194UV49_CYTMA|nr:hypothetical protein VP1G_02816 [Valsa mali var. pyri (nom. inval.)]